MHVLYHDHAHTVAQWQERRVWKGNFYTLIETTEFSANNAFQVIKGHEVVHRIEYLKTNYMDQLLPMVEVVKCGEIQSKPFYENHRNYE